MTSRSLEALEKISNSYNSNLLTNEWFEWLQIIKQDLERLEQLEKENQELKDTITYENDKNICEKIYLRGVINDLQQENLKLKNAIDILKNKLTIEFDDKYNEIGFKVYNYKEIDYVYLSLDDKSQYNLLKEVLANEQRTINK